MGKVRFGVNIPCTCTDLQKSGHSTTFGCTKHKVVGEFCKYVKKPLKGGRQRFAQFGKKDVPKFKWHLVMLAEIASKKNCQK